jgi:hypothetical protein
MDDANAHDSTHLFWRSIVRIDAHGYEAAHARTHEEIAEFELEEEVEGESAVDGYTVAARAQHKPV